MKFKEYISQNQDVNTLLEWAIFMDMDIDRLDEGVVIDNIKKIKSMMKPLLKKAGIHVSQSDGLIQYLWKANKNIARLLYHAFKAQKGDEESKERVKEIMKSVKAEQVIDVLLKLDQLTLHMITSPIHIIDSLTGTHIWATLNSKALPAVERAKTAIETLDKVKNDLSGKMKTQLSKYLNSLRRIFDIGGYKSYKT